MRLCRLLLPQYRRPVYRGDPGHLQEKLWHQSRRPPSGGEGSSIRCGHEHGDGSTSLNSAELLIVFVLACVCRFLHVSSLEHHTHLMTRLPEP